MDVEMDATGRVLLAQFVLAQGHAANESVPIKGMVDAAEIQMDVVKRLVGVG